MESPPPTGKCIVAKFFDPLYFDHEQDDVALQGAIVPRYYGSYTCELPAPGENGLRSVRLILMSEVPGAPMHHVRPANYSQLQRQNILGAIIDAESCLYAMNVVHHDVHPRNVLILDGTVTDSRAQVVLIDFGNSSIGRAANSASHEKQGKYLPGVPISPLLRWNEAWWDYRQYVFTDWIDWDWQQWLEDRYQYTRSYITEEM